MSRMEEVELTNMCMICNGKGNVLVQNKKNHPTWHGWNFPSGHVEKGEYVTPSVIRREKIFRFSLRCKSFFGRLKSSSEGEVFWYPLSELHQSDKLIDVFGEMLAVFTQDEISEVFYERCGDSLETVYC